MFIFQFEPIIWQHFAVKNEYEFDVLNLPYLISLQRTDTFIIINY